MPVRACVCVRARACERWVEVGAVLCAVWRVGVSPRSGALVFLQTDEPLFEVQCTRAFALSSEALGEALHFSLGLVYLLAGTFGSRARGPVTCIENVRI